MKKIHYATFYLAWHEMNARGRIAHGRCNRESGAGAVVFPESLQNSLQVSAAVSEGTQGPDNCLSLIF